MSTNTSFKGQVYLIKANEDLYIYLSNLETHLPMSKPDQINFLVMEYLRSKKELKELKKIKKKIVAAIEQNKLEIEKWTEIRKRAKIILEEKNAIAIKEQNLAKKKELIAIKEKCIALIKEEKRQKEELMLQESRTFIQKKIGEAVLNDSSFISSNLSLKALDDIQINFEKECLSIGEEGMRMIVEFLQSNNSTNVNLYEFKEEFRENSLIIFFSALPMTKVVNIGILPEQIHLVSKGLNMPPLQTILLQKVKDLPYKNVVIRFK